MLADNFSNVWHEELTKYSNIVMDLEKSFTKTTAELATFKSKVNGQVVQLNQSMLKEAKKWERQLKEMENSFTKTTEFATFKSEVNGQIVQLDQSMIKEAKQWKKQLKEMENGLTKLTEFATFKSKVNGQIVQLNQSMLKEAKQWEKQLKEMQNSFTKTTAELATFKSKVNGQIVQLNQSMLKEAKKWEKQLKEMENSFTKTTEFATFKSEVNGQIVQLDQSMIKEAKQWKKQLKEMENGLTKLTEFATFKSKVNGQIVQLNQSMLKEAKQWERQLKEMEKNFTEVNGQIFWLNQSMLNPPKQLQKLMIETCTKAVASEIHKLKMDSNIIMDEIKCPMLVNNRCKVIQEQIHKEIELKVGQSSKVLFESSDLTETLPVTFTISNFNEMKNTEQWYGSPFFVFNGGYLMNLEVHPSGYGDGKGTHVSLYLRLMKGPHDDQLQQSGHWPLRGTFTVKLLNKIIGNDYYTREVIFSTYKCRKCTKRVIDDNLNDPRGWGYSQFVSYDLIQQSNCNENLYFNVSYTDTNPLIPCKQIAPVTLTMPSLSEQIKNKEQWYSDPFFAFEGGYQMCLKVYAGGYHTGEGTHLSVYIHLMKGPHDDKLQDSGQFPLKGIFNITLLNRINGNQYHRKSVAINFSMCNCDECVKRVVKGDITPGCGKEKFLSLHDTSDYLKSSSLDFEIFYEDINPPDLDETPKLYSYILYIPYIVVMSILYAVLLVVVVIYHVVYYIVYIAYHIVFIVFVIVALIFCKVFDVIMSILFIYA